MGNIVNTVKRFSSNDTTAVPAQRFSDLSTGTSRLDKCTCISNGVSVPGETASASKGGRINWCKDFCEEVANKGMHMTPGSPSTKGGLGDIDLLTLPMVHARPSGSDKGNKERETPNGTVYTDARELEFVHHSEKSCLIYRQTTGHMVHSLEDKSTETPRRLIPAISTDYLCKVPAEGNSFRTPNQADDVENSPATYTHRGKELFDHSVCEELADGPLDSCYKSSAEVALYGQKHEQRMKQKSLNYDVVPIEVISTSANLEVSNSKSSMKGRAKRKRNTKASSQIVVPKGNTGTLVTSDLICLESEKQPTNPLVKRSSGNKVLQGTPISRMSKTPLSYVHQSPLTRRKSKAPPTSTPESVKMKRSRSGRLIVPRLDPGSQNIVYDPDGCICGITNLEAQFPRAIGSEPPSKRSWRLSPDQRLLTF